MGEFKDGKKYGQGKWIKKQHRIDEYTRKSYVLTITYEGEFKEDLKNGKGICEWSSGSKYEGDFVNDERHGKGKMTWRDGTVYEGQWAKGQQNGKGKH